MRLHSSPMFIVHCLLSIVLCLLSIILISGLLHGQSQQAGQWDERVLYDAAEGTDPDEQGWIYLSNFIDGSQVVRYTENGVHRLNTMEDVSEMAGYFGTNHPQIGVLDRQKGFSITVNMRLLDDINTSQNRGGFSVILLSEDLMGTEVVFTQDTIWVYTEYFFIAEQIPFDVVAGFTEYTISVENSQYEVTANDEVILSGLLRNYSGFGTPYNVPNFIFFGDNTSRSGSDILISKIILRKNLETMPPEIPERTSLHQNYPNPFQKNTAIVFELDSAKHVKIEVYAISGHKIATLTHGNYPPGIHIIHFNGHGLASGLYLYRLTTGTQTYTKKMLLTK